MQRWLWRLRLVAGCCGESNGHAWLKHMPCPPRPCPLCTQLFAVSSLRLHRHRHQIGSVEPGGMGNSQPHEQHPWSTATLLLVPLYCLDFFLRYHVLS